MNDHMKEAERLLSEYGDAVSDVVVFAQDPAGYSMRVEATRAALLAHIQRGAVPEPEQIAKWAAGWRCIDESDGLTGEASMLDRIAHAVHGAMLAAAPSPDHFRDATKMMAAPAGVSMPKPVAYGFGNTAITGHTNRLMMVRLDVPLDDQYAGVFWHPLVLADEAHTYGVACRAAGEAAGYARGLRDAVRGAVPLIQKGEVLVTVTGLTGSGKSAIAGEIEIMCRALGLEVEWGEGAAEKHLTHADWTNALEMYRPRVRIVEANIPRTDAALRGEAKP